MAGTSNGEPPYPEFLKPYLEEIKAKIPSNWIEGPTRKGGGWRWQNPKQINNQIRIDPGRPEVSMPTQKIDHVVINHNGRIIGSDGKPISGGIRAAYEKAHIPLTEWLKWTVWYAPEEREIDD